MRSDIPENLYSLDMFGIAAKIKRLEIGKTLDDVARETGLSKSTMHGVENGFNATMNTIIPIAKALDIGIKVDSRSKGEI